MGNLRSTRTEGGDQCEASEGSLVRVRPSVRTARAYPEHAADHHPVLKAVWREALAVVGDAHSRFEQNGGGFSVPIHEDIGCRCSHRFPNTCRKCPLDSG